MQSAVQQSRDICGIHIIACPDAKFGNARNSMRADDPRLEKGRKEAIERNRQLNALTLTVIRGHDS
jgi:hypothetical protein